MALVAGSVTHMPRAMRRVAKTALARPREEIGKIADVVVGEWMHDV
jgi:hypothetical protein